jgi:hypothetical protein
MTLQEKIGQLKGKKLCLTWTWNPQPLSTAVANSVVMIATKYGMNVSQHVRFSNRPFGVKRFQTVRRCSVDVTHGLVLLFGIGTRALPSWDSKTRWSNLLVGLAVRRTAGPSGHANSPHPSSREGLVELRICICADPQDGKGKA